jgi:hypothetical protein
MESREKCLLHHFALPPNHSCFKAHSLGGENIANGMEKKFANYIFNRGLAYKNIL